MTIGIMAAVQDEIAELIALIDRHSQTQICRIGIRDYYVGSIEGQSCVLVVAGIGKVAAASTAVSLIQKFDVSEIVFTGLAGGLADHVRIGDVVIADSLMQHDMDARPLFPRYEIPLTGNSAFKTSLPQRDKMQSAVCAYFKDDLPRQISPAIMAQFGLHKPQLHLGLILSGDQFIGSEAAANRLRDQLPAACAVEMEGAAVSQICHEYEVPYSIVRTISDRADATAPVDFSRFLTNIASKYSSGILRKYLQSHFA